MLLLTNARTTLAVPSGRKHNEFPDLSSNEYIYCGRPFVHTCARYPSSCQGHCVAGLGHDTA